MTAVRKVLRDAQLVTVRRDGNDVTICAVYSDDDACDADGFNGRSNRRWNWGRRESLRLTMTVRLPRGARLRTTSGNGDISVKQPG
jgi:hypothetical protein